MKIMVIGSNEVYAMEHFFIKHLNSFEGNEAFLLPTNEWLKTKLNLYHKIERRISKSINFLYNGLNHFVIEQIDQRKPDVILIFKGMELYPDTLAQIRKKGILLSNFNPDHPFILSSRGSGNNNVIKSIKYYDLHFCYSEQVANRIITEYKVPSVFLPFGYEFPENWEFSFPEAEKMALCFIGTVDPIRLKIVKHLLKANIPIQVFGSNWHKHINSNSYTNLQIGNPVYGLDFWLQAIQFRVQLNIFRPHNVGSHNMRTFEMPAVGAILLTPDSHEQRKFFEADREVFYYSKVEEIIEMTNYLLLLDKDQANQIRIQARNRSLLSKYSYKDRVETIQNSINEII